MKLRRQAVRLPGTDLFPLYADGGIGGLEHFADSAEVVVGELPPERDLFRRNPVEMPLRTLYGPELALVHPGLGEKGADDGGIRPPRQRGEHPVADAEFLSGAVDRLPADGEGQYY